MAAPAEPLSRTCLYQAHRELGAKMVPFAGWEMPIQYTSILTEARAVRSSAGIFDVSHMGRLRFQGQGATAWLDRLLTQDVAGLASGRARYGFILDQAGGILDDVIVYRLGEDDLLLVCNAANRPAVLDWLARWTHLAPTVRSWDITQDTAMIAYQGPKVLGRVDAVAQVSGLRPFAVADTVVKAGGASGQGWVSRTGYTGEDGVEFVVPASLGPTLWRTLMDQGAAPCGLGARDVLRLEAALPLHGHDIDRTTTPLEAGLMRFVAMGKADFLGKEALEKQQASGLRRKLAGFQLLARGIPRPGCRLLAEGREVGAVTSGGYSPTLDRDIGMGYVAAELAVAGAHIAVDIRGRAVPTEIVPLPFYSRRRG
ncbi:MAG: glycine cleavage system aminomethyltransferase GcvT [Chloroflexi bacterium]|nr:glycine cleavage system aminomethyltransferase GcvT [Chloroflexota bacterium]